MASTLSHSTWTGRRTNIKQEVCNTNLEDLDPIFVPQKLSVAKFSIPLHNFQFREPIETSVASLANNSARRIPEPWTLTYSSHFTHEAKKEKLEHVLKKINPAQFVRNLLPFVFQIEEIQNVLLFRHN